MRFYTYNYDDIVPITVVFELTTHPSPIYTQVERWYRTVMASNYKCDRHKLPEYERIIDALAILQNSILITDILNEPPNDDEWLEVNDLCSLLYAYRHKKDEIISANSDTTLPHTEVQPCQSTSSTNTVK